jgi:tetratricopeptide (TPR) repeat protein
VGSAINSLRLRADTRGWKGPFAEGEHVIGKRVAPGFVLLALGCAWAIAHAPAARAQELGAAPVAALPGGELEPVTGTEADLTLAAPTPAPAPLLPGPVLHRIERAWSATPATLEDRVARTRSAADESGITSLDPLGRALVFGGDDLGSATQRAEAAVVLAPDLPAAHAALARARFDAGAIADAISAAFAALRAVPRSFDGSLWFATTASVLLFCALAGAALFFVGMRGLAAGSHAAHDLGDHVEASMPAISRVALLAALVLLPAALGEGFAGALLGLLVIALWQGRRAHQIALVAAALLFVAAIHPIANFAGAQLAAIGADPVVAAVVAAESGAIDPVDAARLTRAAPAAATADGDPLALYSLAQWTKRSGDLPAADARFTTLLEADAVDPSVLASAASAKIGLGDPKAAVELYRRAIAVESSALLWFNLSQAHGRAIDVEQHDRALAAAQSLDPDAVRELTARLASSRGGFVADLPLSRKRLRARLAGADADAAAAQLRAPFAPGVLGRSFWIAALAFSAASVCGIALQRRVGSSTRCLDCGTRLCLRCGTARESSHAGAGAARCEDCRRRRIEARAGAAWDARAGASPALAVRLRNAFGWLLPGLAGRSARRPGVGLVAAIAASMALAFSLGSAAVVPDPATVGAAGVIAFDAAAVCGAALYAALALLVFRLERRSRA